MISAVEVRLAEEVVGSGYRPLFAVVTTSDGTQTHLMGTCKTTEAANRIAQALQWLPGDARVIELASIARDEALEQRDVAFVRARKAEERLATFLKGGRLFGRAVVTVTETGAVWLQDPKKRDSGFGVMFETLADLWRAYPDLRPVSWENGELIVESFRHAETA
jgi:hypothetical protein